MKKLIITSGIIIFAFLIAIFYFISTMPKYAGDFSLDDFSVYIENEHFQTDKNYGKITDYKSAAAVGKTAISDRFENIDDRIFKWMSCDVKYDKKNGAYYIRTYHLLPALFRGAYDVIIQSDGTVLAIWGEK